jgi:hypothetical protein
LLLPSYGTVAWRVPTPPVAWRINETLSTVDEGEITEIQIHYKTMRCEDSTSPVLNSQL